MIFRRFVTTLAAASLAAAAAMAQTGTTVTRSLNSPLVGFASSETAQINVVNLASASSGGTAASCTGTIAFYNSSGTAVQTATPFTVTSGQVFSANLAFAKVGATGVRAIIRGVVTLTQTLGSGVPCALQAAMETYDTTTGVTHQHFDLGEVGNFGGDPRSGH
jgi:hypothetical protein